MWTILKFKKNQFAFLKKDFKQKLGDDVVMYSPKLLIDKFKKNKLINLEFDLLGDYIFCYHKKFENPSTINEIRFSRGLNYFLEGFISSQAEIKKFVENCKGLENDKGYINQNIYEIFKDKKYKFSSGPFANQIFKIMNLQKDKISISIGNLKTVIDKEKFLFYPV